MLRKLTILIALTALLAPAMASAGDVAAGKAAGKSVVTLEGIASQPFRLPPGTGVPPWDP